MIDTPEVPESLHSQRERGRLQAPGYRIDDEDSHHTFLIINEADGSWVIHAMGAPGVHQQAPTRWEAECVVPLRFGTCLIDPADDDTTYLELRMRDLKSRDQFYGLLPLDIVRQLRDQLTEHLDAVQ